MVVFLDIDGTIINNEGAGPYDDDIVAIERAREKGSRFLLCTGRGYAHIPLALPLSWIDGVIAGGGVYVLLGEKVIYHKWVPVPVLNEIASLFLAKGKRCSFQGDNGVYAVNQGGSKVPAKPKTPITAEDDFIKKYPHARISMLTADLAMGDEERMALEKYFDIYPQIPHYDCFIKGESKAKGMQIVLDALHLDRSGSAAIGDSANDLDMIHYAGTGIAMGNACEELKAVSSWISAPVGEGGIARALEYLRLC